MPTLNAAYQHSLDSIRSITEVHGLAKQWELQKNQLINETDYEKTQKDVDGLVVK